MSHHGEDVQLSSHARALFRFTVECKATESFNIWKAFAQAERTAFTINQRRETTHTITPLVVVKRNRSMPLAVLSWHQLLRIAHMAAQVSQADLLTDSHPILARRWIIKDDDCSEEDDADLSSM